MRPLLCFALLLSGSLCTAEENAADTVTEALSDGAQQTPDSHAELAEALVGLLRDVDAALDTCRDEESTSAALPRLRELKEKASALTARQAALPEPTVQDYMAAQASANDFLQLAQSVNRHVERLQEAGLLSEKIRDILRIAPEKH